MATNTTRTFPYRLVVTRPGSQPVPIPFMKREDMSKHLDGLLKKQFVGSLEPQFWNGKEWMKDADMLEAISSVGVRNEHKPALLALSKMAAQLAKTDVVTDEQKDEFVSILHSVFAALGIVEDEPIDADPFSTVDVELSVPSYMRPE